MAYGDVYFKISLSEIKAKQIPFIHTNSWKNFDARHSFDNKSRHIPKISCPNVIICSYLIFYYYELILVVSYFPTISKVRFWDLLAGKWWRSKRIILITSWVNAYKDFEQMTFNHHNWYGMTTTLWNSNITKDYETQNVSL